MMYVPIMGNWNMIALDAPTSMIEVEDVPFNPETIVEDAFGEFLTIVQWLNAASYERPETDGGMDVDRYSFDEKDVNSGRLPDGMVVEEASGDLYVMVEEGYLVGLDMTLSGQNLSLSEDREEPMLSEGTVVYHFDLSEINQPLTIELPEESLRDTEMPEDIPLPEDAIPSMVFNMMGVQQFSFSSDSQAGEVADFYRSAMPENGWTEVSATEEVDYYQLEYSKDDRSLSISIVGDAAEGKTGIDIMPSSG